MKKVLLLATAFMFVTGVALADKGKKKNVLKEKPAARKTQKLSPAAKTKKKQQLKCNSQEFSEPHSAMSGVFYFHCSKDILELL